MLGWRLLACPPLTLTSPQVCCYLGRLDLKKARTVVSSSLTTAQCFPIAGVMWMR
jgi:hypothetical protein